ncbi:unnamed protein product [Candidatus Protochlamydia amoebophila UWE25]|uniref:Uncharacterized protein n=2 Tax=Candidatus Protochlamydia TaxID=282132 RepID=A0A2P9HAA1_PARUW|nr:unnamed protein product [Candidatus Protochlamydia amoebophila UWE25]
MPHTSSIVCLHIVFLILSKQSRIAQGDRYSYAFCFSTFIAEETTNIQNIHVLSQHTFYLFCLFVFKTYFKAILFFDCFSNFCKLTEFLSNDNKKEEKTISSQ